MTEPDPLEVIVRQWQQQLPDLDTEPLLVVGRIQRLAARWDPLLRPRFAAAGLAPGDFDVLAALRRAAGTLTPSELAEAMLVTPGAATKRIDRLVEAALVTRERSDSDGRGRLVALTAAGVALTDRLIREHLAAEAALLGGLDPRQRRLLADLLSRLLRDVEPAGGQPVAPPTAADPERR